jgi:hypothetical protein
VDELHLPFEFLPEAFTLGELQLTCEQLLGRPLDKSSFWRRLADRPIEIWSRPSMVRCGADRSGRRSSIDLMFLGFISLVLVADGLRLC